MEFNATYRMRTVLIAAILLGAWATVNAADPDAASPTAATSREGRWKEDLGVFARDLPARHLDFFKLIPKKKFNREVRKLENELPRLSDVEVVFRLMRLGARVGVAHTWVGFPPKAPTFHGYPLMFHWFSDRLAVVAATLEYREVIGARVLKIGSATPRQAVAAVEPYISCENQTWLYKQSPLFLRNAELLQYLRIAEPDGRVRWSFIRPDGKPLSLDIAPGDSGEPAQWISAWDALGIPPVLRSKRHTSYSYEFLPEAQAPYWYEFLPEAQALYTQYKKCADAPGHPFASFARKLFALADSNAVQRVIVDLRYNGGGDSRVIGPLVSGLKSRPALNGKGHLYVLIGPGTFSSAVLAAIQLRNEAGATLVGQPTGGKPNCYGESPYFRLPNSQMEVHYCTKNFRLIPNADPPSLDPDIRVALSLKDFLAGRDPVLEAALRHPLK